ncbi:SUN domain-containing protein 1-like [Populus alba x Populus x berolinensis]|uniref:Nuclear migration and anchoring protein unc-84 n=3 Tax=Populus TaxID=3689 RepID=A0A4U5R5W0_POPAL|nr:SUN domain-containing protein 1-like [Populus alba]KAJ6900945.1 SUN domain-containing protein 1-like [Populus alba x Populus x berolinensis]KAJ6983719.1 SUN domain-containing protein 1-like [Populus alba x Populus x berolinensis]TKS17165.1 nuclear migration and anchoring protein unc-84 [Populus alba]
MSASTVSITANPASARRRPVVVSDKKSPSNNIELVVPHEQQINGGGGGKANVTAAASRDLSHHSILERTVKDLQVKKTSSTISPRRARKVEKPRWMKVVSVFTKNFVLLLVLAGLVQMVRKLAVKSGGIESASVGTQMGLSEFDGRIAEMESMVKTAVKMIQVQVEVVDKKIASEVGGLRREISKKIDDKGVILEKELRKLVERSEGLEKKIGELKAGDWLSKEDFEKFYEQFKKAKGGEFDGSDVSLDDIMVYAREIVQKEIEKHAADGLGRVDYALASSGGMVVKHSDPYMAGRGVNWFLKGRGVHPNADEMLKPSFGEPGKCFALKGSSGFVQIKLRGAIVPEAVTLEHVAKSVAYDRSTAPKDCRVSGWLQNRDLHTAVDEEKMLLLTEFTYDLEKSNAQTFNVMENTASGLVDTVRLDFTSNHGSPSLTCIYRLRVHGYEPDPSSMTAMQP